jgi:hypothetical protein
MAKRKKNNTSVAVYSGEQLPSCDVGVDIFEEMTKGSEFLQRVQLFTKGKLIDKGLIGAGHYGVPGGEDEVIDLGPEIDIIPYAWRPKALDTSDRDAIIEVYDAKSAEFLRIQDAAGEKDSGCMYGPTFLVYERGSGKFYELFCGNASGRISARSLLPYCPLSESAAAAQTEATGKDVEAHGPEMCSLGVKYTQKKTYGWHVIVVHRCSTPFDNLPSNEEIMEECKKFVSKEGSGVEKVEDDATGGRAR